MYKTLTTALGGATLLLGASLAQADVVTLSVTELDGVTAGWTLTGPFSLAFGPCQGRRKKVSGINGSFNGDNTNNNNSFGFDNTCGINGSFNGDNTNNNNNNSFRGSCFCALH